MRSRDVIALYDFAHIGMHVTVTQKRLPICFPRRSQVCSRVPTSRSRNAGFGASVARFAGRLRWPQLHSD